MKKLTGLDFWDACREVAGTDRRLRYDGGEWHKLDENRQAHLIREHGDGKCEYWRVDVSQMKSKKWEVEPEKPEEVCVWGRCFEGQSRLFGLVEATNIFAENHVVLKDNCLFLEDKPQKYRLAPVEHSVIPWKDFKQEPPTAKGKEAKMIIIFHSGDMETAWWSDGDFRDTDGKKFMDPWFYCPVSQITKPEQSDE